MLSYAKVEIAEPHARQHMRILVADDHYANQLLAQTLLQRDGHDVHLAQNGHAALALCETLRFHLILMDIQMPGLDGFETLQSIRSHCPLNTDCPVFALTAYSGADEIKNISRAGFQAVLTKPFRSHDMYARLETLPAGAVLCPQKAAIMPASNRPAAQNPALNTGPLPDLLAFAILDDLRAAAGTARVKHIVQVFWKDVAAILTQILSVRVKLNTIGARPDTDIDILRKAAHALKGAAANIGFSRVSRISAQLQNAPPDHIPALLKSLEKALRQSKSAIETYLETEPG